MSAGTATATSSSIGTLWSRYSFTAQYVLGSRLLADRADVIESGPTPSPLARIEHRAAVVGSIMQACAAMEAAIGEVLEHGPRQHLGGGQPDPRLAAVNSGASLIPKSNAMLVALGKPVFSVTTQPFNDVQLLVWLRNHLVHYQSTWQGTMRAQVQQALEAKALARPSFIDGTYNFFPHQLLGVSCARWAYSTAAAFIDAVYDILGEPSALDAYRSNESTDVPGLMPPRR
jgi:hypothetical protein